MASPEPPSGSRVLIVADDGSDGGSGRFSMRKLLQFMGPGILMSIAYVVRCNSYTHSAFGHAAPAMESTLGQGRAGCARQVKHMRTVLSATRMYAGCYAAADDCLFLAGSCCCCCG